MKKVMFIMSEDGPHDRALYRNSADGTARTVEGGDAARYGGQLDYLGKSLAAIVPAGQRCTETQYRHMIMYLSIMTATPIIVPDGDAETAWDRTWTEGPGAALASVGRDLDGKGCRTVLYIHVAHLADVRGVYTGYFAYLLSRDRQNPVVYKRILYSDAIPVTLDDKDGFGRKYAANYRGFVTEAMRTVLSDLTGVVGGNP